MSDAQWLTAQGFCWRDWEADMDQGEGEWNADSPAALADSILRRYPLIGQYELSGEEFSSLFAAATACVQKMSRAGTKLSRREQLILTVATVSILKKWGEVSADETSADSLWTYIYLQYGFRQENSEVAAQQVYKNFCAAIEDTLTLYHRFLAPRDTMRFYTSMLLHAIAPRASIENLFEILFDFYVKNLDFQYVPEDSSYKTLVRGMQARWTEKSADIQLKGAAVMSGLKTLFLNRPGYMALLCEELVKKIDALLRGESFELRDRWDLLLTEWFQKKSSAERGQLQGEKRSRKTEFVATSAERIYVQYAMENGSVGLSVPRIRLTEVGEERPVLALYQGTREIFRSALSVTGNDLGLTTRRRFVALEETNIDLGEELRLCAEIEYLGDTLYASGSRLYRTVLCFDCSGNERSVKTGTAYLFTDENRAFDFADEDCVTMEDHAGQLYRVNMDLVGTISVDGTELFADEKQAGKARLYPSVRPARGIEICFEGKNYPIFQSPFSVQLHLPEAENPLRYQLSLDGGRLSPEEGESGAQLFRLPGLTEGLHVLKLVDLVQTLAVLEYPFALIPGFSWALDRPRYLETEEEAQLTVCRGDTSRRLSAYRLPGSAFAATLADPKGFQYEVELPTVGCSFGERSAFTLPERLWYKAVGKDVHSRLQLPPSWQGRLLLGLRELPLNADGRYEIGNFIHSGRRFEADEMLWLALQPVSGETEHIPLTRICFAPCFTEPPLQFRVNELQWLPRGRYIGEADSRFRLRLSGPQDYSFTSLPDFDKLLCRSEEIRHGHYTYEVFLQRESLFSAGKEEWIFRGDLVIGDENEFRFEGRELRLSKAIYWDIGSQELKSAEIQPGKGVLEELCFLGVGAPDWESIAMPEYEARLSFENRDGRRIAFNANPESREYLLTNPVHLWVVNDRRLILTTVEGEVIYFDTATASIPNRDPELTMSRAAQRARLQNPDYFEYETRRADDV